MKYILSVLVLTWLVSVPERVQTKTDDSLKIDSYGAIACDDAMARLDFFAAKLRDSTGATGYVVVYPEKNGLAGRYHSYVDFTKSYLTKTSGIASDRLTVVRGEDRKALTTELWLVPKDAPPPVESVAADVQPRGTRKFDEGFADYMTANGKQELWTYDLCPLGAVYIEAFAGQLRREPEARGQIIVHAEQGKSAVKPRVMAKLLRIEMVKNQGIDNRRIIIRTGRPLKVPSVELWIISPDLKSRKEPKLRN